MSNHTKLRALICEAANGGTMHDMVRRVAEATPPDQLATLYRASLPFAIEAILEDKLNSNMDNVFGTAR